jgi:hypothetical protein
MLKFVKAFWEIVLWRKSPAQLPASALLLGLVAAAAALLEVIATWLPAAPPGGLAVRIGLSVILQLAFAWVVLAIARQRQRFLQTGTALLGVGILAGVVSYPLESLINHIGTNQPAALPLAILYLTAFIWYLLACANIWRAALESRFMLGSVISLAYFLLSLVVEQQLMPKS